MRHGNGQPWYTEIRARLRFERGARTAYPGIKASATGRSMNATVTYTLVVDVPEYEERRVRIELANWTVPGAPVITVDGPSESPHRYGDHHLCIWLPDDPVEQRWVAEDGLLALIDYVRVHLFKEGYWRETGLWPGPEAPHGDLKEAER